MSLRKPGFLVALVALSTLGFSPAALKGQSVPGPNSFRAHVQGNDVVLRWSDPGDADLFVGEMDGDPRFGSPRRWTMDADGRRTHQHVLRDVPTGVWYLRVRAIESFLVIRRQSDWSHVERVAVGRDGDSRDDDPWDDDESWDGRGVSTSRPREIDADAVGNDDVRVTWSPVRDADRYVLQLDDDRRFRDPYAFTLDDRDDRGVQRFTIRNVPDGRWYVRVRAVEGFVSRRGFEWSPVAAVDVGRGGARVRRDDDDFRNGRGGDLAVHRRGHPVFEEHPGRGRGKGHVKHGRDRDDDRRDRGDRDDDDDDD